ncbi:hypothetical protein EV697_10711 [Bisgaardia hudsonensis]|uniref:Uncharacterized protein n=1 Tax=Bisgaardia hudsonensis TaxID=109472 RepID=A0A4R2MT41_9PAST|nr:hypothetical protein [Bisgaardia hudsonensis]TCP11460.1 hypothetical protein EV697_10711 [Bisgaardia hudsonensis]
MATYKGNLSKKHPSLFVWFIALLPYEIGLLFCIFSEATLLQVMFWAGVSYFIIILLYFAFKYPLTFIWGLFIGLK